MPELEGLLLLKVEEFPGNIQERIDGESYSGQRHDFTIFAQRAGEYVIPPIAVQVTVGGTDAPSGQSFTTEEVRFRAKMPPATEKYSTMISTADLKVEQSWEPEPGKAKVGDAFTRKITFRASNVLGMAFPALVAQNVDGLRAYPEQPQVRDMVNRGELTGERVETVTYVCEKPGAYELPGLVIPWWDLREKQLKRIKLPATRFEVAPDPALTTETEPTLPVTDTRRQSGWLVAISAVLITIATIIWSQRRRLMQRWSAWRAARQVTESAYFRRVLAACRLDDPVATFNALMGWLDHTQFGPRCPTLAALAATLNDEQLTQALQSLQEATIGRGNDWSGRGLAQALARARRSIKRGQRGPALSGLPSLNPLPGAAQSSIPAIGTT